MSEDVLPYEIEGSVAMDEIARNDELRAVILTGTGQPASEADFLDRANKVFDQLRNSPKPVSAVLNGLNMAGGLELSRCAGMVVAGQSAPFGRQVRRRLAA